MGLSYLNIHAVRNLQNVVIEPDSAFNLFYGANGSGKTSILEAIHLLALGRSFRQYSISPVIQHEANRLAVFGRIKIQDRSEEAIGLEKDRYGKTIIKINGEIVVSPVHLAELLPIQMIHPESDELLTGSPKLRRQFLDWGTFHVEPLYFECWKRWQKSLKQRNAAIKAGLSRQHISIWDGEYAVTSENIEQMRASYAQKFAEFFQAFAALLLPKHPLTLYYQKGWPENESLMTLLEKQLCKDQQLGYTSYGPQRSELNVKSQNMTVGQVLSRGEQKLVVIALRLAQGKMLKELTGKQCLYLLDDFASELDVRHRRRVIETLTALNAQVFITAIEYNEVKDALNSVLPTLFHVERGEVRRS